MQISHLKCSQGLDSSCVSFLLSVIFLVFLSCNEIKNLIFWNHMWFVSMLINVVLVYHMPIWSLMSLLCYSLKTLALSLCRNFFWATGGDTWWSSKILFSYRGRFYISCFQSLGHSTWFGNYRYMLPCWCHQPGNSPRGECWWFPYCTWKKGWKYRRDCCNPVVRWA